MEQQLTALDHIAYATKNSDKTAELLTMLGFKILVYKEVVEKFNSYVTKLASESGDVIELVEPMNSTSAVAKLLQDKEASVYHVAFTVPSLADAQRSLKQLGAVTLSKPFVNPYPVRPVSDGTLTTHMYHPYIGIFELTGDGRKSHAKEE